MKKEFFIACLAINLAIGLVVLILQSKLPPVVPLLYGMPVGEEELVPKLLLTIPSLAAILLLAVNFSIAKVSKDAFVQKVLIGLTIAVTLLASITTVKIFFLVASF